MRVTRAWQEQQLAARKERLKWLHDEDPGPTGREVAGMVAVIAGAILLIAFWR